jgi:asparagine synthetase B (glutamine-hydrolysing)
MSGEIIWFFFRGVPSFDRAAVTVVPHAQGGEQFDNMGPIAFALPKIEFDLVLPGQRVVTFDHSSMAAGLELRTPFLSRQLVETVATFDPRSFMGFGQKSVLRRILSRYLPESLFDFPKSGFTFPQRAILDQFSNSQFEIPGVPTEMVREAFRRRHEGVGWERLAVRLVLLDAFLRKDKNLRPGT